MGNRRWPQAAASHTSEMQTRTRTVSLSSPGLTASSRDEPPTHLDGPRFRQIPQMPHMPQIHHHPQQAPVPQEPWVLNPFGARLPTQPRCTITPRSSCLLALAPHLQISQPSPSDALAPVASSNLPRTSVSCNPFCVFPRIVKRGSTSLEALCSPKKRQ